MQKRLAEHLRGVLRTKYEIELENIPLEIPPDLKFGELATPVAFELARKLRKAPKIIAQEIVAALGGSRVSPRSKWRGRDISMRRFDRAAGACAIDTDVRGG